RANADSASINEAGAVTSAGTYFNINGKGDNYTYQYITDCYGRGPAGEPYHCPEGTWCQVESRMNWYPWDVSYMNRGRCLPYVQLNGACEPQFEGDDAWNQKALPRKANGEFFERPVLCAPELICTGETIHVLPSTCVKRRLPEAGCMSSAPFCAGRSPGDCPSSTKDMCVCPRLVNESAFEKNQSSCTQENKVTREKLEHCGSIFNSFNGPNFAFAYQSDHDQSFGSVGLPDDHNIAGGDTVEVKKLRLYRGLGEANFVIANRILQTLWPYPVCDSSTVNCTQFPLPVLLRDYDGELLGNYTDGRKADWMPEEGRGVTNYHCTWMILHTLSVNGKPLLSAEEQTAFHEAILYLSSQFDCKVCRSNIMDIIKFYGMPKGNLRSDYAWWFWRAHNHANEHTYATHSPSQQQIDQTTYLTPEDRRWDMWANAHYEHPWFMPHDVAMRMWNLEDL
ncbi:Sulfhydryl oxidase, partial [Durusdinium trenchii]